VRHVPATHTLEPLEVPRLRVLGLVASPLGLPHLDVSAEQQRMSDALKEPIDAGLIELEWLPLASWFAVQEKLMAPHKWHVLHFIGHGDYDVTTDQGRIALMGESGRADMVEADRLAVLLTQADPRPRLVVLNSCSSGEAGAQDLFSGTAAALVRSGISAVAAMQFTISDPAAIAFTRGFYTAIAHGYSIDDAARFGRVSILGRPHTLEWVTPVLYVRGESTQLFTLTKTPPPPPPPPTTEEPPPPPPPPPETVTVTSEPPPPPPPPAEDKPQLLADPQWIDAASAYFAGRWPEAVERFEALHARYPGEARVEARLQQACRQRDVAAWSDQADTAARTEDWDTVVSALENLTALDPTRPDVATRLEEARTAQRRRALVDEMTALHQAGRWDAVVAAAQELARLDPDHPDPGGIVSDAQAKIREADLADRYTQALNELDQQQWQQAADLFAGIEQEQPGFRDAAALRNAASQHLEELNLADKYRRAADAQSCGDWVSAATIFTEITDTHPDYRDAATRRHACENQQRIADLQAQLRNDAAADQWQAVIDASQQIAALDPSAADPGGLATQARDKLEATQQRNITSIPPTTASGSLPALTVTATVPVGTNPHGVAVDPGSRTVYVTNYDDKTVSVIDGSTRRVTGTVPVGGLPTGVAVDPGSRTRLRRQPDIPSLQTTKQHGVCRIRNGAAHRDGALAAIHQPSGMQRTPQLSLALEGGLRRTRGRVETRARRPDRASGTTGRSAQTPGPAELGRGPTGPRGHRAPSWTTTLEVGDLRDRRLTSTFQPIRQRRPRPSTDTRWRGRLPTFWRCQWLRCPSSLCSRALVASASSTLRGRPPFRPFAAAATSPAREPDADDPALAAKAAAIRVAPKAVSPR
jgi:YVTN family beta-propeller protein